jgi:hypothetical protein
MKQFPITFCCILLLGNIDPSAAQVTTETAYRSEAFGSVSSGNYAPFWTTSHSWGMVPHRATIGKNMSWQTGIDLAASTKHAYNTLWLQQIYAEASWKQWNVRLGSKEDYKSILDKSLSSGDFVLSNNARPTPELNISLKDFIPLPLAKGNIYVRGDFAIGKFLDAEYVEGKAQPAGKSYAKDFYSHHKSMFFRFGNLEKASKWSFTLGMEHYAMFGGMAIIEGKTEKYPAKFSDFMRTVFIAEEGGSYVDYKYKSGSHIGAYTLRLDHLSKNRDTWSIYWHHFIEDGSSAGPQSFKDMLLGIQYKSRKKQHLSGAVLEYVYTKNQSGPVHFNLVMDDEHKHLASNGNGMDDYYNNVQYIQGPSYYGRSIGTPLFLSPEYNTDGNVNFKSNRIIALHAAAEGYLSNRMEYRLRATIGETWGRYKVPYIDSRKGIASSADLTYHCTKKGDLDLRFTLAFNSGKFFGDNSFGTGISIIKRGVIFQK